MKVFTDQVASGKVPGEGGPAPPAAAIRRRGRPAVAVHHLAVVLIVSGCWRFMRMRAVSRERRKRARVGSIGTARSFHAARLDAPVAAALRAGPGGGRAADDPALAEHHQTAGAKLVALRRQLPQLYRRASCARARASST